jgi:hypothetical protein
MLGRFDPDPSKISYNRAAGNDYTYFELDNWEGLIHLVNENKDEMWRLNKQFLHEQFSQRKDFYFSHDPYSPESTSYFSWEVEYLIDLGVKDFIQINKNLWKAIW